MVVTVTVPSESTINESSVVAAAEGREPGQPIILVAERRMDLFDAGGRFERHVE